MTWYYADWSWAYTLTTRAAVLIGCVVLASAIVNWVRELRAERQAQVVVTNGFVQRSPATIARERALASDRQNGRRAA